MVTDYYSSLVNKNFDTDTDACCILYTSGRLFRFAKALCTAGTTDLCTNVSGLDSESRFG